MNEQETLDYARIAQAIGYIRENFKRQPGLCLLYTSDAADE